MKGQQTQNHMEEKMSTNTSSPPLVCMSLHELDKIRFLNLSPASIDALRAVILSYWQRGIQSQQPYGISYEFKLFGNPWLGSGEEANASRRLITGIMHFLLQRGWGLSLATSIIRLRRDKDTFYFKPCHREPNVQMCSISFNEFDIIRVIDGPQAVAQVVRSTIQKIWYRGIQSEGIYYGAPQFKMFGRPWVPSGIETMETRMLIGGLIRALEDAGWEIYGSIDISSGKGGNDSPYGDLDTWVLRSKPPSPTRSHSNCT